MTFNIDKEALDRAAMESAVARSTVCSELLTAVRANSITCQGVVGEAFIPVEARLLPLRLSLMSFEEDWNAPGMDAYDHL